ncbi:radical SAM protein [Patescibacteria group bacterium]|nr:radical SAM protein [Patescibacteria group bacterium]
MNKDSKIKLKRRFIGTKYTISRMFNFPFVSPSFIQINVTGRCNLKCKICTTYKFPSQKKQELTVDEIKNIILQADRMRIKTIVFSGGEPFLRNDIFEIIKFVNENTQMKVTVTTNGTLIDRDVASKIIDAKVNNLQISLDGASDKTHDYIRGQGSFKKTLEGIKILNQLKDTELTIGLSFTVNIFNYTEMLLLLDLGRELSINHILFIPFIEDNTYTHKNHSTNNFLFDSNKINSFKSSINKISHYREKYKRPVISNFDNLALYEKYFAGKLSNPYWRCFAGFHWIQINPHGDMSMCGWEYGNIRSGKLKKIWYSKEARKARMKIKRCKQLCLQPCMSKP